MPQLIFKGVKREDVKNLSKTLPSVLSEISQTPKDYFTFECPNTEYFFEGEDFKMYPLVKIIQFERLKEIEEKMALTIQEKVKTLGYSECEVYFIHIEKENYYE